MTIDPESKLNGAQAQRALAGGLRKAAILLVSLDPEVAAEAFRNLSESDMEKVSQEISALGMVAKEELVEVLGEFKDLAMVQRLVREGGYANAIGLINKSLPPEKAGRLVRILEAQQQA